MANLRISEEQLRELIYEYQKTKDKKVAVRINCVIAWGKGWDWATIEDILMVSSDFINKTVAKYQKGGIAALTANNYFGNHYKMTAEQEEKVKVEKERNITIHLIYLPPYSPNIDSHAFTGVVLTSTDYRLSRFAGNLLSSPPLQAGSSRCIKSNREALEIC